MASNVTNYRPIWFRSLILAHTTSIERYFHTGICVIFSHLRVIALKVNRWTIPNKFRIECLKIWKVICIQNTCNTWHQTKRTIKLKTIIMFIKKRKVRLKITFHFNCSRICKFYWHVDSGLAIVLSPFCRQSTIKWTKMSFVTKKCTIFNPFLCSFQSNIIWFICWK